MVQKGLLGHLGKVAWKLLIIPYSHLQSESPTFSSLLCYSFIANQKRLEIINEDDVEAYVGLRTL